MMSQTIFTAVVRVMVEGEITAKELREYLDEACGVDIDFENAGQPEDASVVSVEIDWGTLVSG
jgi:hypothetical protein